MFLTYGLKSIAISLIMFFTVQILNVFWQITMLTIIGEVDRNIKVSDEYNLFTIPFIFLITGIILIGFSLIFERKKINSKFERIS